MARPRGANRRRFVLALIVLTSVTLITLDSRSSNGSGPLGAVSRIAHDIVSPADRAVSSVARPVSDWWSGMIDSGKLKRENRSLRDQVSALTAQSRSAQIALAQDKVLKRLLGLRLLSDAKPIAARVVDRNPGNFESTITLDRGTEAGIENGMAVLAPAGVVGHVIRAWRGGSEVRVLIDPDSAVAVRTTKHPVTGIAQGRAGSNELTVADFDASAQVSVGENIVTADLQNSVYPPDLAVGRVTRVDVQAAGLGLVVHIAPYVDFDALEFVVVLRWVPGEGPVVEATTTSTTTTTTTTLPGASTSSTSTSSTGTSSTTSTTKVGG